MELSIRQKLERPFPIDRISWRVGSTNGDKTKGIALAYIDARDVMKRLDDVLGMEGWQDSYTETPKGRILCNIGIKVADGSWVYKTDGAGDTDFEGDKGAISDAFKRAAVKFGVGRYLYDLDNVWVEIQPAGKSYKISGNPPALPPWATPEGFDGGLIKERLSDAVQKHADTIKAIKEGIATENLSKAAEAWFELTDSDKESLWVAPTKFPGLAPFTTDERAIMKTPEFRKAHTGV